MTYNLFATGNSVVDFAHNGRWVTARNSDIRLGGMASRAETRDELGRKTCVQTDDTRITTSSYSLGRLPDVVAIYGRSASCLMPGTYDHSVWLGYTYNTSTQSRRLSWTRRRSVHNGVDACSGGSLPAGCSEDKYDYVSATDDRVQWVTTTGYTRLINDSVVQQIRKERSYYYALDTATCNTVSTTDTYAGQPCRVETQDSGGTVFARADYTYYASGASGGLVKTERRHDKTSDPAPLTTTFNGYDVFGLPTSVTDEAGMTTTYARGGWGAVISVTEAGALLDDSTPPVAQDATTLYIYNKLRRPEMVVLPNGSKRVYKYFTGATDYARPKAWATADVSGNLLEIMRYEVDAFGNRTEEKILDSINGTTPCADENCTTYEVRRQRKYNARRQLLNTYLHATDTADPPDATSSYTYTEGHLTNVQNYLGANSGTTYDDLGRVATTIADDGGLGATTTYGYDGHDQLLTTTSPTGVVTRTEHDDFGQLVLDLQRRPRTDPPPVEMLIHRAA